MADTIGNTNQMGVVKTPGSTSMPGRPGNVSHGTGKNKPRIHLVSSKGKVPAEVYADVVAHRQGIKSQAAKAAKMPTNNPVPGALQSDPHVKAEQLKNPAGVAKRPNPPHQNNPALAGRFTPQGIAYANQKKAPAAGVDNPTDSAATEARERKLGIKT